MPTGESGLSSIDDCVPCAMDVRAYSSSIWADDESSVLDACCCRPQQTPRRKLHPGRATCCDAGANDPPLTSKDEIEFRKDEVGDDEIENPTQFFFGEQSNFLLFHS